MEDTQMPIRKQTILGFLLDKDADITETECKNRLLILLGYAYYD